MRSLDFSWFEQVVQAAGLGIGHRTTDECSAAAVSAGHRWTVTAQRSRDTEGADGFSTVFTAASSAAPAVGSDALRNGVRPVALQVRRDDRASAHFGGDEALGLVAIAVAVFRRQRKDTITSPRDRVDVTEDPAGLVPQRLVDRIACWPGDAAFGLAADQPPPSAQLARTPEGGLAVSIDVSPWRPLTMWTNAFGDRGQFEHALSVWGELVMHLAAAGALVVRDPATIIPPSAADVNAAAQLAAEQLKALKAQRRDARRR